MKAPQEPCDLARALVVLRCQRIRRARQLLPQVAVRETVQGVFAQQEHFEEHAVIARQWIECGDGSSVFRRCLAVRVSRSRTAKVGSCTWLKASRIWRCFAPRSRDIGTATSRSCAGVPTPSHPCLPGVPACESETLRIVDHRLHPQYRRSDGSRTVAGCRVTVAPGYSLLLHLARGRGLDFGT